MLGHATIRSYDDPVTALKKLHWSLVPEFLILDGKESKDRLRNYTVVLSEAELGHIEKLCGVGLRARKPKQQGAAERKISKGNGRPGRKMKDISAKKALSMGRLF
jgi:hypothetical protein